MIARLVCLIFRHLPARGVSPAWCWRYHCERCGSLINGGMYR